MYVDKDLDHVEEEVKPKMVTNKQVIGNQSEDQKNLDLNWIMRVSMMVPEPGIETY